MKVKLNISKLLKEGKITREEHDRFLMLARQDGWKHAWGAVTVLGLIAIALGAIGLFPNFFDAIWDMIHSAYVAMGRQAFHVLLFVLILGAGVLLRSGFLAGISCFVILSFLSGTILYKHASYTIVITEPAMTVLIFALLAIASLLVSKKLPVDYERLAIIFSRTCLILINIGFWVGSLWGSESPVGKIPAWGFSVAWMAGLLITLVWGAKVGRLFVVNAAICFGAIHLYTQWFENLGAKPLSLLAGGLVAAGLAYAVPRFNRYLKNRGASVAVEM
ncbi:MAG: hypothetical protein K8R92_04620 [Planctomycetes bacterium]|nr:hypothetical protein [Planctomycetota bacterium]